MRYRITVRGDGLELRGYLDDEEPPTEDMSVLRQFSQDMSPFGIVIASTAPDDYDPFREKSESMREQVRRVRRDEPPGEPSEPKKEST